ncbi:MAG: ABC transporter ATP-binding protein [Verrucomicrobiales bacterium]|nr:ABC transporter ATP-binding protein [Verrucomicrobiales bacterium]
MRESSAKQTVVAANDVFRTFQIGSNRIEVLKGVSIEIRRGEKLFLSGASGAGKTSLLYTLAGLEQPNEGNVIIDGKDLYRLSRKDQARLRNEKMGYVFQNFFLLPELTAIENVLIPSLIGRKQNRDRAAELLERVGLGERLNHLPAELSGGEQQRVAIARSLVNDPEIIFADEPTGNLDSKAGRSVMDLLMDLVDERERTLLVVTHDTELAESGDRKIELADGRVVRD